MYDCSCEKLFAEATTCLMGDRLFKNNDPKRFVFTQMNGYSLKMLRTLGTNAFYYIRHVSEEGFAGFLLTDDKLKSNPIFNFLEFRPNGKYWPIIFRHIYDRLRIPIEVNNEIANNKARIRCFSLSSVSSDLLDSFWTNYAISD